MLETLDTFPAFLSYWTTFKDEAIAEQIEGWRQTYMAEWPELLEKQISEYASEGSDWRQVARERVFPHLDERISSMKTAHDNLLTILDPTVMEARRFLEYDGDLMSVVYVGIGLGAGWATTYQNKPAVLYGLENIAECGWVETISLQGLIAHEIGHLVHFYQREQAGRTKGEGPLWQLYCEGVAMRCEHKVCQGESWHMRRRPGQTDWLNWCRSHQGWLAGEFLRRLNEGESVRPFFGSWYDLKGYYQTGYFLGHELIRHLEARLSWDEIALMDDSDVRLRESLLNLAETPHVR